MNIGEILVRFGADVSGFMGGIRTATAALGGFGTAAIAAGAIVAGLAAIIGVISVKAAADFQQGLNRLVTGAGDVTDNMGRMGQSILATSTATGVLTGQLLPAMYQIISAGQRGAQAQDTLRVAAMGSVTEQAKVVDVAKALTTAMTDYGTTQYNATQFMNGYTRATQLGKLTLEQLSTSMGPILPLAKNIGISFADVAGAMSTMTNAGIPAERSATSLRFLFQSLENPTHKATVEMEKMGLSSVAVGNELKKSLPGALEMIYKAALKAGPEGSVPFNRAVSDMIGGQRSLQAYLSLTGTHFATYRGNVRAIADAMNFSKTAVLGWDVAQSNFNVKLSQAHAALDALFITIGAKLLPVLSQIVGQITPIIQRFADWVTHTHDIENAIAAVTPYFNAMFDVIKAALPVVIGLFLQFVQILGQVIRWLMQHKAVLDALMVMMKALGVIIIAVVAVALLGLVAVFVIAGIAILAVVSIVMTLMTTWKMLAAAAMWVSGAWNSAIAWLVGAWHSLVAFAVSAFNAVKNAIVTAFNATIAWIVGAWNSAIAFIVGIWHTLSGAATSVFNAVKTAIMTAVNAVITWLVNAWNSCVAAVVAAFTWLYNHNYYWKALVDFIRNAVQSVITWLQGAWQNTVSFLVGLWNTIAGAASSAFNATTAAISSAVNAAISWLQGAWNSALAWLGGAWNTMAGLATSAWNAVVGVFNAAIGWIGAQLNALWAFISGWFSSTAQGMQTKTTGAWQGVSSVFSSAWGTYIAGPLGGLANNIAGFFNGLVGQMIQFGRNLIQGLVDGINSMLGAVSGAASNVASTITSILGFHSPPKYGPAHDADKWMPNMVGMMTSGMTSGVPSISKAATQLAQPLHSNLSAGGTRQATTSSSGTRPIVIQVSNREYRAFVDNLGNDLVGSSTVRVHFAGGR